MTGKVQIFILGQRKITSTQSLKNTLGGTKLCVAHNLKLLFNILLTSMSARVVMTDMMEENRSINAL